MTRKKAPMYFYSPDGVNQDLHCLVRNVAVGIAGGRGLAGAQCIGQAIQTANLV